MESGAWRPNRRAMTAGTAAAGFGGLITTKEAMAAMQDDLTWTPAWRIRDMIAKGEISAVAVTEHFLSRIERLDPKLHMFRKYDRAVALDQARAADLTADGGGALGPLHGVPVALKEEIAVKGMPFFKLTPSVDHNAEFVIAQQDSIVAERLRKAGAIIVGVTVMPGMGLGPGMPDLEQHPRNPWDPERVPGSSSAGSAAVVASGALPVAIGSDSGGSNRVPAALTGVIGVLPTIGRVPNADYDRPHLMVTASIGPIARDVRDAATVLQVIAGPDGRDMLSTAHGPTLDYLAELDAGARGMRLAWTDDFGFTSTLAIEQTPRVIEAVRNAAQSVKALGATLTPTTGVWESFWPHCLVTDSVYGGGRAKKPTPEQLQASLEVRARNRAKFDALLSQYDALLSPTIQFTAPTVVEANSSWRDIQKFTPVYTADTFMFAWIGLPAISIPCGFVDGLPVGLQLVGSPNREAQLFRLAQAFLVHSPRQERPAVA